jgi:hypothetical protein
MKLTGCLMLICMLFSGNLSAQRKKPEIATTSGFAGGIVYSLPRTGVRIFVEVSQEKYYHGPYYEYAQKYLGIKGAPATDFENWTITGIKVKSYGEPDPGEIHKASGQFASLLSLSEDGMLIGINSKTKGEGREVFTSEFTKDLDVPKQLWPDLSMHSFLTEKDSARRTGESFKSFEEKAAEAAHDILKLRKRKALALADNYDKLPPDGKAYQVMVEELDKIIDEYTALFIGKSYKANHKYTFEIVPDNKGVKGLVAFRFSNTSGVLPESNVSGKPVMIEIEPNTDIVKNGTQASAPVPGETSTNGVYYRIPGIAVAKVLYGGEVLAQARLSIAQFGVVTALPDALLNGDYSIELHKVTGAIERIGE